MKWYHKLIGLTLWNSLSAGINFLSNIFIARMGGVELFGTYSFILSTVGMLSLMQVFLPSSYAVIRLQDDSKFIGLYSSFYGWSLLLILFFCIPISPMVGLSWSVLAIFTCSILLPYYADAIFQSENRLKHYFILLFVLSVGKITSVAFWSLGIYAVNISVLLTINGVISFIITIGFILPYLKYFSFSKNSMNHIIRFLQNERTTLSGYYSSSAIKIINSNMITLLCNQWVTRETLGIYSLLIKVNTFIVGLARTMEAVLTHREGIRQYGEIIRRNTWAIGFLMQVGYMVVGAVYMFFTTGETFWMHHLFLSTILYPYLYYMQARAQMISEYTNSLLNKSGALFSVLVGMFVVLKLIFDWEVNLEVMTGFIGLISVSQYIFLLWLYGKQYRQLPVTGLDL